MSTYVAIALGGLPIGAMYALTALGIVIVYKTSRVFNFATGAIGLACAYLASTLSAKGVPIGLVIVAAVSLGVTIGIAMEVSVRPVRSTLTRTIVTLGWLLALQGAVGAVYGTQVAGEEPARLLQPSLLLEVGPYILSKDQAAVIAIAAGLVTALALFFRYTALGTATRAVSEAPDAARLLGIRVDRVNLVAWGIGGGISGLAGVLVTPLLDKLDTTTLVVFTVQALAAALVGRLSSLPLTLAGGLGLGMLQPVVARFASQEFPSVRGHRRAHRAAGRAGCAAAVPARRPQGRLRRRARAGAGEAAAPRPGRGGHGRRRPARCAGGPCGHRRRREPLALQRHPDGVLGDGRAVAGAARRRRRPGVGVPGRLHGRRRVRDRHRRRSRCPSCSPCWSGAGMAAVVAVLVGLPAIRLEPLELAIATLSLAFTADRFLYNWAPLVSPDDNRPVPRPGFAELDGADIADGQRAYAWLALGLFLVAASRSRGCDAAAPARRSRRCAARSRRPRRWASPSCR